MQFRLHSVVILSQYFAWKNWKKKKKRKIQARTANLLTWHLPNTMQECYPLDHVLGYDNGHVAQSDTYD
jgi:hypothetical protein